MSYIINKVREAYLITYLGYLFMLIWTTFTALSFLKLSPLPKCNQFFKSPYITILLYSNIINIFYNFNLSIVYLIVGLIIIKLNR